MGKDKHFLVCNNVIDREVGLAIPKNKVIAELGAGDGRIVERLLEKGAKEVWAIETDPIMLNVLNTKFKHKPVKIIDKDIREVVLDCDGVVGNIPYSISKDVFKHLTQQRFSYAVVIVQREFARKLLAKPSQPHYRAISVLVRNAFSITPITHVKPSCFQPPPKVVSTMLLLRRKAVLESNYITFVEELFTHKNKLNTLLGERPRRCSPQHIREVWENGVNH